MKDLPVRAAAGDNDAGLAETMLIASPEARADALVHRLSGHDRFVEPTPCLAFNISTKVFSRFALLMWSSPTLKRVPAF